MRRKENERPAENGRFKRGMPGWLLLAGLMLVALLAAVSCGASGKQGAKDPSGDGSQASVDLEHPSLGEEDAPVVLTEYSDYQ